ncbi:hypothetical protein FD37_GL000727 [Levilactobacillus spicheri DSM 15429]|uniref:Uncharacterized protein n=1 Tax=Levilactobacillus spicheri DSM 15429 TaxID=1423805 RepID=A0A0R1QYN2_9LACO|nr:hypothetical protein FD37_GL000727 [Levilactobacillus spicheri DSM 15429]
MNHGNYGHRSPPFSLGHVSKIAKYRSSGPVKNRTGTGWTRLKAPKTGLADRPLSKSAEKHRLRQISPLSPFLTGPPAGTDEIYHVSVRLVSNRHPLTGFQNTAPSEAILNRLNTHRVSQSKSEDVMDSSCQNTLFVPNTEKNTDTTSLR